MKFNLKFSFGTKQDIVRVPHPSIFDLSVVRGVSPCFSIVPLCQRRLFLKPVFCVLFHLTGGLQDRPFLLEHVLRESPL